MPTGVQARLLCPSCNLTHEPRFFSPLRRRGLDYLCRGCRAADNEQRRRLYNKCALHSAKQGLPFGQNSIR